MKRRWATRAGFRLDRTCECGQPDPVIVGGDGFYIPPLMCANCHARVTREDQETGE
jgi:hypothetical protein